MSQIIVKSKPKPSYKTCPWCGKIHTGDYPVCDEERNEVEEKLNPSVRGE